MNDRSNKTAKMVIPAILILFICSLLILWIGGRFLITGDRIKNVDALVVLSGDDGARVKEASKIYQSGFASYLVISKSDHEEIQENRTNSEKMMRIAIDSGVASDAILFTNQEAGDTIEEARQVLEVANQRQLKSLLIITDPYHTRRTKLIFKRIFEESGISIFVHGITDHWYKPTTWFLSIEGWKKTIEEFAALFFFLTGNMK